MGGPVSRTETVPGGLRAFSGLPIGAGSAGADAAAVTGQGDRLSLTFPTRAAATPSAEPDHGP